MNARKPIADYVHKMAHLMPGVKALLLDHETAAIIGLVVGEHQLLLSDIFLITRLHSLIQEDERDSSLSIMDQGSGTNIRKKREIEMQRIRKVDEREDGLRCINALVFVRPTAENISYLREELQTPRFGRYHLLFSNYIRKSYIEEIADADVMHVVKDVEEYFADYYALGHYLVSMGVTPCLDAVLSGTGGGRVPNPSFERVVDGLVSLLLATVDRKKNKVAVRYQGSSRMCRNLAERIQVRMGKEKAVFDGNSGKNDEVLLLILDRCEDPVTPLLNQWTYQAMIHELIGLYNNRLNLEKVKGIPRDLKEVVMDPELDDFFMRNCHVNFGDLGSNLKLLINEFERTSSNNKGKLDSIDDMMDFVRNYPQFRKKSLDVSKHVAVTGELSRMVQARSLLQVSQLEQDLACREAETEHRKQVLEMLINQKIALGDKLRLVLLYSLRYEQSPTNGLATMKEKLYLAGHGSDSVNLITQLRGYGGHDKRAGDLFSNRSFFAKARNTVRRGIGGVENIYTQHEPLLAYQLHDLFRRKLPSAFFPLMVSNAEHMYGHGSGNLLGDISRNVTPRGTYVQPPSKVIVFIAGGVTYEEERTISAINGEQPGTFKAPEGSITASAAIAARQLGAKVVLGGSTVHNSASFLQEVARVTSLVM